MTNTNRTEAEKAYKAALARWNVASAGTDAAFELADAALVLARANLAAAEIANPTAKESARKARFVSAACKGFDVFA